MSALLYLLDSDAASLRHRLQLLSADPPSRRALQGLRAELDRALVLPAAEFPADVVRIGSRVEVHDLTDDQVARYTLCFPEHAEISSGRLSVFAPLGTALLGFAAGHEFTWEMPGGLRRFRILSVTPPDEPEASPRNSATRPKAAAAISSNS